MPNLGLVGLAPPRHVNRVRAVAFSPDGPRLATASGPATVWDAHTGEQIREIPPEFHPGTRLMYDMAFSANGHWLAAGGLDATVHVWNPAAAPNCWRLPTTGR